MEDCNTKLFKFRVAVLPMKTEGGPSVMPLMTTPTLVIYDVSPPASVSVRLVKVTAAPLALFTFT